MDEFVSKRGASAARFISGIIAMALVFPACAEVLRDPTRPPAELEKARLGDTPAVEAGPRLQSVLISPQRRVAVINGQTVVVGDNVGAARVVKISENEVVLKSGNATQTLTLFAGIEKKRTRAETLAAKAGGRDKISD